jgi:ATP-dependent DNA ligase
MAQALPVRDTVLDGEIVHLGPDGSPRFFDLTRRPSPHHYFAFDLAVVGRAEPAAAAIAGAQEAPLPDRAAAADAVAVRRSCRRERDSRYEAVCDRDLEGIVAKLTTSRHLPKETTWVKIKNSQYSQA